MINEDAFVLFSAFRIHSANNMIKYCFVVLSDFFFKKLEEH